MTFNATSEINPKLPALGLITNLVERLENAAVQYCHWKSNYRLESDVESGAELDLLVGADSAASFEQILGELFFKPAVCSSAVCPPGIAHYYAMENVSGRILHLHVYYRLVTGGGLLKNYRLPIENAILSGSRRVAGLPVPPAVIDLMLFVVRKSLESGSLLECAFLSRERAAVQRELSLLLESSEARAAAQSFAELLGGSSELWLACCSNLQRGKLSFNSWRLGLHMQRELSRFRIFGSAAAFLLRVGALVRTLLSKFIWRVSATKPLRGGALIAFVGGEASGKSTSVEEISRWLAPFYPVTLVHSGKPPATLATMFPRFFLPLLRRLFHRHRTNVVELGASDDGTPPKEQDSLMYMLRSVMIAYDQQRHIMKAYRKTLRGHIVICDRYPSALLGGMDGPRLDPVRFETGSSLKRFLAQLEQRLYNSLPAPDCVFHLTVPLAVALERNSKRKKKDGDEPQEYVIKRHSLMSRWGIPRARVIEIENEGDIRASLDRIRSLVWSIIHGVELQQPESIRSLTTNT